MTWPEEPPAALPPQDLDWDDLLGRQRDPQDVADEALARMGLPRRRSAQVEGDPEAVAELKKELGL